MKHLWSRPGIGSLGLALLVAAGLGGCSSSTEPLPETPAGLAVNQLSLTSVRVSWTAVSGATSYKLQRASAASPGVFSDIGGSVTNTSFDDTGLTSGVAYSYQVAAV